MIFENHSPKGIFWQNMSDWTNRSLTESSRSYQAATLKATKRTHIRLQTVSFSPQRIILSKSCQFKNWRPPSRQKVSSIQCKPEKVIQLEKHNLYIAWLWKPLKPVTCMLDLQLNSAAFRQVLTSCWAFLSFFFSERSYFRLQISDSLINFCYSHRYIQDIYLMFWKPGSQSPITNKV